LTLTAAQDVIMVDRPWMWDDVAQAWDRAHRLDEVMAARLKAQADVKVTAYWLQGFEVDHKIDARLMEQRAVIEGTLTGKKSKARIKSVNELAKEIADELFAKQGKSVAA